MPNANPRTHAFIVNVTHQSEPWQKSSLRVPKCRNPNGSFSCRSHQSSWHACQQQHHTRRREDVNVPRANNTKTTTPKRHCCLLPTTSATSGRLLRQSHKGDTPLLLPLAPPSPKREQVEVRRSETTVLSSCFASNQCSGEGTQENRTTKLEMRESNLFFERRSGETHLAPGSASKRYCVLCEVVRWKMNDITKFAWRAIIRT